MIAGDGKPGVAEQVVYFFNPGARSTATGWVTDYFNKRKVTSIDRHAPTPDQPFQSAQENVYLSETWRLVKGPDSFSAENDGDIIDTPSSVWGESSVSEEEPTVDEDRR